MPELAPITGVTSRAAASTAARAVRDGPAPSACLQESHQSLLVVRPAPGWRRSPGPLHGPGGQIAEGPATRPRARRCPGSFCFSFRTGSNRSPSFSIRLIAAGISKRSFSGVASLRRCARPRPSAAGSRRSDARARAASRRRSSSSSGGSGSSRRRPCLRRSTLAIFETTSFGVCFSSSCATALANGLVSLVGDLGVEREVDLHALAARGLRESLEPERAEDLPDPQRDLAALDQPRRARRDRGRRRARSGCSIPVAFDSDGCSSRAASWAIQISVGRFSQRQKSISPALRSDIDRRRLHPIGPVLRAVLLEEGGLGLADSLGEAPQRQRPALEVGQDQVGDPRVVVDHLAPW